MISSKLTSKAQTTIPQPMRASTNNEVMRRVAGVVGLKSDV